MSNEYYKESGLWGVLSESIRKRGILSTFGKAFGFVWDNCVGYLLFMKKKKMFVFNGRPMRYFYHKYNKTWKNERAVEIPIAIFYASQFKGKRILEVGNVLNHYTNLAHVVLDKYEAAPGVINEDIMDFAPKDKFDLVVSISTMEHVGVDDVPKNPKKAVAALIKMQKDFISKDGKMIISFPTNYNSALNEMINNKKISNFRMFCYKKVDETKNIWEEVEYEKIKNTTHVQPVRGVIFLEISGRTKIK